MELHKHKKISLVVFVSVLLLFLLMNFWMVAPYLLSVATGMVLAVSCRSAYGWLIRKKVKPKLASGFVTVGIAVMVVAPLLVFSYLSIKQAGEVGQRIAQSQDLSFQSITEKVTRWKPVQSVVGDAAQVEKQMREAIQNGSKKATGILFAAIGSVPEILLQVVLALLTCFFFILDGNRLFVWLRDKIPFDPDVRARLYTAFVDTSISSLWATMAAAAVQAALMLIGFLVLQIPMAFFAAGATFIFAWIPILGSTPVWVGGAIYLYTQGSIAKMIIMLVLGCITGVADNLVRPLVLKGRGDMHPLIALVAIFGGIKQFGLLGVFFGPILFALFISLMEIWPSIEKRFGISIARNRNTSRVFR